ncbi:MAG: M6 family metalloprotease domain-containing protein [Verrucomicrobiota bacterium]
MNRENQKLNTENQKLMKTMNSFSSTSFGRIILHSACILRHPQHFTWHWQGIVREFSFSPVLISPHATTRSNLTVSLVIALVLLMLATRAHAINASPHPVELTQPDGAKITLHIRGDEHFNWHEDTNGFTVVRSSGRYVYAKRGINGALAPTDLEVGKDDPKFSGLAKGVLPAREIIEQQQAAPAEETVSAAVNPTTGTLKNLVILCKFSDHTTGVQTRAPADYDVLFNRVGGDSILASSGSIRDYYQEISYGKITIDSTVVAWVTLPNSEAYYANGQTGRGSYPQNAQRMVEDALNLIDPLVNFAQFDANNDGYIDSVTIIHSGYGAEWGGGGGNWIWSHKWGVPTPWISTDRNAIGVNVKVSGYHTEPALWGTSGTTITRIGVICHEIGHAFGLPDLYDTDKSSSGIGSYCLMANSWGFDGSQLHPPHMSAWCKMLLGWVAPTAIGPGVYVAPRVETSPNVFRVESGYPSGEYLLIENRQPAGFESDMPQGGLAIWHIDESKPDNKTEGYPGQIGWPANGNHYKIALLQADGRYDLEHGSNRGDSGDLYRAGQFASLATNTTPNSDAYQSGNMRTTGNLISVISAPSSTMLFAFNIGNGPWAAYPPGDVNADMRVNGADIILMSQGLTGSRATNDAVFSITGFGNGDLTRDGAVSGSDPLLLKQVMVQLRPFLVTTVVPGERSSTVPTQVLIYGVGFPTNGVSGVVIGPPVNLTLSNVSVVSSELISALVPAGGGIGTGTVQVIASNTNGVLTTARFINR